MEKKENYELTPKGFLKTISILHLGLLAGPLIFGIFTYSTIKETKLDYSDTNDIFLFLVPFFAFSGILVGNILFKEQIEKLKNNNSLREKLSGFQTASIIKYALLEGPAVIGIVAFNDNGNLLYLIISGIMILYFISQRPTNDIIETSLNFTNEQQNQFNQKEQIIA